MNIFKKVLKLMGKRKSILKNPDSVEKFSEFKKAYLKYATFEILQNDILYYIVLLFTEDIEDNTKMEILYFLKNGLTENIDLLVVLLSIGVTFQLSVTEKKDPDTNELKLFIGNVNLYL